MGLARWMLDLPGFLEIEKRTALVEGRTVHYWKAGDGQDLIILHGLLGTASVWEGMAPFLGLDSTVYTMDSLCSGKSERVPGLDPRLEAQADRVAAFMESVGVPAADFLATSHGGAVALMLAARHPQRVRSLILNAPANPFSDLADYLVRFYQSQVGRWFASRIPEMPEALTAMALGKIYTDSVVPRPGSLDRYLESLRVPGTVDYVLRVLDGWFDDMNRLKNVLDQVRHVPVLLVWGDDDRVVSLESGQRLQRCFDAAELIVLPGAGHLPYEECPKAFGQAIAGFLRETRIAREPGPKLVWRKAGSVG